MGFSSCEIVPDDSTADGHTYKVTVDTSINGHARLNIACLEPDGDKELNSQGVDLGVAECRALAKILNATADLAEEAGRNRYEV